MKLELILKYLILISILEKENFWNYYILIKI